MSLCKISSSNLDSKIDKNTDSYLILFAQTILFSLKQKIPYLRSKGFYENSDDGVCPIMSKITMNLWKNCSDNLDNKFDKNNNSYFILFA